jgi:hypothetical protein
MPAVLGMKLQDPSAAGCLEPSPGQGVAQGTEHTWQ